MRKALFIANWKMNLSYKDLEPYTKTLKEQKNTDAELVIAPPFLYLESVARGLKDSAVKLGAQNAYWEAKGAFTGEVSFSMLKELGTEYVILGHSERRTLFHETNQDVEKKVRACMEHGLKAVLCIGESLEERDSGKTFDLVKEQLAWLLEHKVDSSLLTIAYEPVWAIGTGVSASVEQAQEVHAFIRDFLRKSYGEEADKLSILYGGSVNLSSCKELMAQKDIDGALIGGASLDAETFIKIATS